MRQRRVLARVKRVREAEQQLALVEYLQSEQRKAAAKAQEQAEVRARVTRDIRAQLADNEYRKIMEIEAKEQEAALLARAAHPQRREDRHLRGQPEPRRPRRPLR